MPGSVIIHLRWFSLVPVVLAFLLAGMAHAASGEPYKVAVFDIELQDASHEGERDGARPDQAARLALISGELRKLMIGSEKFEVIDTAPAVERIRKAAPIQYCNGCEGDIARDLGADYALAGFVYKVSNLILEIHLFVRDTETGLLTVKTASSIRGNTDESWLHGIRWMFRNRLMKLDFRGA